MQSRANTRKEGQPTHRGLPTPGDLLRVGWGKAERLISAAFVFSGACHIRSNRFFLWSCVCVMSVCLVVGTPMPQYIGKGQRTPWEGGVCVLPFHVVLGRVSCSQLRGTGLDLPVAPDNCLLVPESHFKIKAVNSCISMVWARRSELGSSPL